MRIINLKYPKNYDLVLFSDAHYGNKMFHEKGFQSCLEFIRYGKRHAINLGDLIEGVRSDDYRFDETIHSLTPAKEMENMGEFLTPVSKLLDVVLMGNHEYASHNYGNLTQILCKDLSTPQHTVEYGTYSCVVQIYDDEGLQFKMYLHHGFGSVRSQAKDYQQAQGNVKANLRLKLKDFFDDVLIAAMGHTHRLIVVPPTDEQLYLYATKDGKIKQGYMNLGTNANYIDPDRRYYINTGSFLKLFDEKPDAFGNYAVGYAEMKGYKPIDLGFINIEVRNRRIKNVQKIKV